MTRLEALRGIQQAYEQENKKTSTRWRLSWFVTVLATALTGKGFARDQESEQEGNDNLWDS